jgi:hypothetical protein
LQHAALILGAGFSYVAGLPLTRDLFDCSKLPLSKSDQDLAALDEVARSYKKWISTAEVRNAELWLAELFEAGSQSKIRFGTTYEAAIQFALRRLVDLKNAHPEPYYHGICTHYVHPTHQRFWSFIKTEFDLRSIVTLNYDILVEQALHEGDPKHRSAPQCYYGGFMYEQVVRKMTNVTKRESELVSLGKRYRLYKLHGSINWAWEHTTTMKIHNDVRAIFRRKVGYHPAIIAPIPEKDNPDEFKQIWHEARKSLIEADVWIVCGYSMPDYDIALTEFFQRTLTEARPHTLFILDPDSENLVSKWDIPGSTTRIIALPGLPEALDCNWRTGGRPHRIVSGGQYELF